MIEFRRPTSPGDWARLREICCEAAYGGAGLEDRSRREFFGRMWVGPYERLLPEWTTAAWDNGRIVGYLNGCPETISFERRRRFLHDWPLAARVLAGRFSFNQDTRSFLRRAFGLETAPAQRFSPRVRGILRERYPAHLHINLARDARASGTGRRMLGDYFERLSANGTGGVHVHCGQSPLGFYLKAGFELLESQRLDGDVSIFVLGKRLK